MTESERPVAQVPPREQPPGAALVQRPDASPVGGDVGGKRPNGNSWMQQHQVILGGLLLIAADLVWRAHILSHLYFRQDDFENLDLAFKSQLNWHYLSYIGSGDFMMGQRLLAWLITRGALYNWPLASAVILVLFGCAALAAFRILRTLFGEHPAILILLAIYLLAPLTVPSFGWWSSAAEELPVQLAIFMALNAHVWYLRNGRSIHLAAAVCWVAFGLFCYEKALVLPLLLFAVTAGYFVGRRSFLAGAWVALVRYRTAWLAYAGLLVIYTVLLVVALHTAIARPQTPHSAGVVVTFIWDLLKNELVPGSLGGPWRWLPVSGGTYAIAATSTGLTWLALLVAVVFVGASIVRRKIAWRAWTIWIGWVVLADMVPVIIRRLNDLSPALYALETRYVSDSAAVLVICLGLAFLRLVPEQQAAVVSISMARTGSRSDTELVWRRVAAGVLTVFVLGSLLSTQSYYTHVSGVPVARYVADAKEALRLAPKNAVTVDAPVPGFVVVGSTGPALASTIIGDMAPGRLRWITLPRRTIDALRIFGSDGRLYLAKVQGGSSPYGNPCFKKNHGRIVVNFWTAAPVYSDVLRIGYLWYSKSIGTVIVHYGNSAQAMTLRPGLHAGYLKIKGTGHGIVVGNPYGGNLCIGEVAAGYLVPDHNAPALPRLEVPSYALATASGGTTR
jgi:hypothetical protein